VSGPIYARMALIGLGLIGSSMAWAARRGDLVGEIVGTARSEATRRRAGELGFCDRVAETGAAAVAGADLVVLCVPVGACGRVAAEIAPHLAPGATLTDVGSVKAELVAAVAPHLPERVHFVPGHPLAGTEHSGPDAGFAELFEGRWTILTPVPGAAPEPAVRLRALWEGMGAHVAEMTPEHHDLVLAVTSHVPHAIAYTMVGVADDLRHVRLVVGGGIGVHLAAELLAGQARLVGRAGGRARQVAAHQVEGAEGGEALEREQDLAVRLALHALQNTQVRLQRGQVYHPAGRLRNALGVDGQHAFFFGRAHSSLTCQGRP